MINSLIDKTILLTGGTGSFGQKFVEIVLQKYNPRSIRVYSRGEFLQWQMEQKFSSHPKLRFFIGDVRDKSRLSRAATDVDIIVHAAALKQIPTAEYNPFEAVKTNILGSMNVVDVAIENKVDKVIAVSSDKACQPVNLYGATKMCMEKLVVQANSYTGGKGTILSCTRYGNVVGSRGSVIPLFLEQKKNGKITITDERMTRFWLTVEQGVEFVISCLGRMAGGEVFVPKIPSMRITDLASSIAPNATKLVIGIRPGEKLHETLITEDEGRHTKEYSDYFIIEPEHSFWKSDASDNHQVESGFSYCSDTNLQWLSKEDLQRVMGGHLDNNTSTQGLAG